VGEGERQRREMRGLSRGGSGAVRSSWHDQLAGTWGRRSPNSSTWEKKEGSIFSSREEPYGCERGGEVRSLDCGEVFVVGLRAREMALLGSIAGRELNGGDRPQKRTVRTRLGV